MEVTKKELHILFGISPKTLDNYIAQGMPGRRGAGRSIKYDVKDALEWFVNEQCRQAVKGVKPLTAGTFDREASEAELSYWKAEKEKFRALKEQSTLVLVDDAQREINTRLTQVRNALDAIPFSWSPFLVALTDIEEVQKRLSEQLDSLYNTLSSLPDSEEEAEAYEDAPSEVVVTEDDDDSTED